MAPTKTVAVAAENLVRLGVDRVATILLELANEQPAVIRRLGVELAGEARGEIIAAEVNKLIATPRSGCWFMALAGPVINRVDDSNGAVGGAFRATCEVLGARAAKARPDPNALAGHGFGVVIKNDYGEFDRLIPAFFPALGATGITALKARLMAPMPTRTTSGHYDSEAAAVRSALQDLADSERDPDAYIALVPDKDRKCPAEAARIGRRLLDAGRAAEAVIMLEAATPNKPTWHSDLDYFMGFGWDGPDANWENVYLDAWVLPDGRNMPSGCVGRRSSSACPSNVCARASRLRLTSTTCWPSSRRCSTRSGSAISRPPCISSTRGQHTDRQPISSWSGAPKSTGTCTICSILWLGGWRAPVRSRPHFCGGL
jgi:hypothetical protein